MGQIADLIRRVLDGKEHPDALGKYWQQKLKGYTFCVHDKQTARPQRRANN